MLYFFCILYIHPFLTASQCLSFSSLWFSLFIHLCPSSESLSSDVRWSLANCSYVFGTKKLTGSSESLKETSQVDGDVSILKSSVGRIRLLRAEFSSLLPWKGTTLLRIRWQRKMEVSIFSINNFSLNFQDSTSAFSSVWCPSVHYLLVLPSPENQTSVFHQSREGVGLETGLERVGGMAHCFLNRPSTNSSVFIPPSRACQV